MKTSNKKLVKSTVKKKLKQNNEDEPDSSGCAEVFTVSSSSSNGFDEKMSCLHNFIAEQIALEGLYGITLQALWVRCEAANLKVRGNIKLKKIIWKNILRDNQIELYELDEPRGDLVLFDRYKDADPELGIVFDTESTPEDIYPFHPVRHGNIRGSCQDYQTRIKIPHTHLTLEQAYGYGNALVIVASQRMRNGVLFDKYADPSVELAEIQYCFLELVGRSREMGELTLGKSSLSRLFKDQKTLFYHRKLLENAGLIKKQVFHLKMIANSLTSGFLLHLPRFYNKKKTKVQIMIEKIVDVLRKKPNYVLEYKELGRIFGNLHILYKLTKTKEFKKFIETEFVYPQDEGGKPSKAKPRLYMKLIDPKLNVAGNWEWEEDVTEQPIDSNDVKGCIGLRSDLRRVIYNLIVESGVNGLGLKQLESLTGLDFYTVRLAVRQMQKLNMFHITTVEEGKQRTKKYIVLSKKPQSVSESQDVKVINKDLLLKLGYNVEHDIKYPESSTTFSVRDTNDYQLNEQVDQNEGATETLSKVLSRLSKSIRKEDAVEKEQRNKILEMLAKQHAKNHSSDRKTIDKIKFDGNKVVKKVRRKIKRRAERLGHSKSTVPNRRRKIKYEYLDPKKFKVRKCGMYHTDPRNYAKYEYSKPIREDYTHSNKDWIIVNGDELSKKFNILSSCHSGDSPLHIVKSPNYNRWKRNKRPIKDDLSKSKKLKLDKEETSVINDNINKSLMENVDKDQTINDKVEHKDLESDNNEDFMKKWVYMGSYPTIVYRERSDLFNLTITQSTSPSKFNFASLYTGLNSTIIQRVNYIKNKISKEKVIVNSVDFMKLLLEAEGEEYAGDALMKRRSLCSTYAILIAKGHMKILSIFLGNDVFKKTVVIFCHPSIDIFDSSIQSVINDLKSSVPKQQLSPKAVTATKTLFEPSNSERTFKYSREILEEFGMTPKFGRAKLLHEYLFYLLYENDRNEIQPRSRKYCDIPVYSLEEDWKMFLAPFKHYEGWSPGWILIGDAMSRMPLSIFTELYCITHEIPSLPEYLRDPIKRHLPIKHVPDEMRKGLVYNRKYMTRIMEHFVRLCHIGVLQFGPQKGRERDQHYIFLNRKASLLNTTTSKPGYNMTEVKEYKKISFNFATSKDLATYWHNMFNISLNTALGLRLAVEGSYVTIEDIRWKPSMVEVLKPRSIEEVMQNDTGEIPGDGRGAAGLDSALWVHLHRNWLKRAPVKKEKAKTTVEKKKQTVPKNHFRKDKRKVVRHVLGRRDRVKICRPKCTSPIQRTRVTWCKEEDKLLKICKIVATYLCHLNCKLSIYTTVLADVMHHIYPKSANKNRQVFVRRQTHIFGPHLAKEYVQEIVEIMNKIPFVTKYFGKLLQKTKETSSVKFLNQINCAFVFLVIYIYEHQNELNSIFQSKLFEYEREDVLSEDNRPNKQQKFMELIEKQLDPEADFSESHTERFMTQMYGHEYLQEEEPGTSVVLDKSNACTEENSENNELSVQVLNPTKDLIDVCLDFYKSPRSAVDLQLDVIKDTVHSAIHTASQDSLEWAYDVFKVLLRYPEELLRSTINEMRHHRLISMNPNYRKKNVDNQVSFITTAPYEFSTFYKMACNASCPEKFYIDTCNFVSHLSGYRKHRESLYKIPLQNNFNLSGLSEMLTAANVKLVLHLPRKLYTVDPKLLQNKALMEKVEAHYSKLAKKCETASFDEARDLEVYELLDERLKFRSKTKVLETLTYFSLIYSTFESRSKKERKRLIPTDSRVAHGFLKSEDISNSQNEEGILSRTENSENFTGLVHDLENIASFNSMMPSFKKILANSERADNVVDDIVPLLIFETCSSGLDKEFDEDIGKCIKTRFPKSNVEANRLHHNKKIQKMEKVQSKKCAMLLNKLNRSNIVKEKVSSWKKVKETLETLKATNEDIRLAKSLIHFVYKKGIYGASSTDIKKSYDSSLSNLSLCDLLRLFTYLNVFLRIGINEIVYVHYKFRDSWLVHNERGSSMENASPSSRSQQQLLVKVKIKPWIAIDGTLNTAVFKKWITAVMSFCLKKPLQSMINLIADCYFLKPTDVFSLVEHLQEAACVKMVKLSETLIDDSNDEFPLVPADETDSFKDIYIEISRFATTKFGIFLKEMDKFHD